ncbi:MAG: hypothetical protein ABEI57_08130 [Halapricum sp.]
MGIKCSLLGHAFGDSSVEREREEQGSEVVITIREIETCARCGETRVVSENKEVTTLETPDDVETAPTGQSDAASQADESEAEETAPDTTADDTDSSIDEETTPDEVARQPDAGPAIEQAEAELASEPDETAADADDAEPDESEGPPVVDDAEILDESADEPERKPGEWPQESSDEDADDDPEFTQFGYEDTEASGDVDEPDTVDESKTDAEFIDAEPEAETDSQVQTNAWPSEDEIDAASESESTGPGAVTVPEGSFVCEGCGFSTPVESSSLRAGDFCPECHQETLVQVREEP